MTITLNALQKQRRDTASNWTSNNPTLLAGEWGIESDTKKLKIGDGSTAWQSLDYLPIPDTNRLLTGDLTISGSLTVNGTTTTIDTTTLTVEDKNIEIGKVSSPSDTTADGGGITLKAASDKTITWSNANDSWDFNQNINAASTYAYRINNVSVLNATTLGNSVVNSSLTSVGTITSGVWNGTAITKSNLASLDIVNADVNASAAIAKTKIEDFVSGNTNNRLLTATGNANSLQGEANLTFTGSNLTVTNGSGASEITLTTPDTTDGGLYFRTGSTNAGAVSYLHNSTVADGVMNFRSGGTTKLVIKGNGNCGIGTTSPTEKLDVEGSIRCNTGTDISMDSSASGQVRFRGNGYTGAIALNDDAMHIYSNASARDLVFGVESSEKMRIDTSGRVGIGTDSMACALHVKHASNNELLRLESGDRYAHMVFKDSGSTNDVLVGADGDDLRFSVGGNEKMRLKSGGNCGIGVTNPSYKLEVAGNCQIITPTNGLQFPFVVRNDFTPNSYRADLFSGNNVTSNNSLKIGTVASNGGVTFQGVRANDSAQKVSLKFNPDGGDTIVSGPLFADSDLFVVDQIRHTGDTDTAIRFPSADTVTIETAGDERFRVDSSGNVLVSCTTTDSNASTGIRLLEVGSVHSTRSSEYAYVGRRSDSDGGLFLFRKDASNVGSISVTSSATAYNTSSDYRLKENVVLISDGITRLKTLKPSRFNFKNEPSKTVDGFLAHEVTAVPEAVTGTKDAVATEDTEEAKKGEPLYQVMDYGRITPLLTAALQEAISKIEVLETKVAALEAA